ncbi:MAG: hypothetical protein KDE22_11110 [Rhodobacterales bacterium]|nr:hypothetical protein [Rhodobacterales bacterium]
MKKLLIALVILMVLTGGAVGTMKALGLGPFAAPEAGAEHGAAKGEAGGHGAPAKGQGDAHGAAASASDLRPIKAPPVVVPLLTDKGVAALYQIQFDLKVPDLDAERIIIKEETRLNDAFVKDMHGFLPRMLGDLGRVDKGILRKRLMMVADRTLGAGVVRDITITNVLNRSQQ